VRQPLIEKVIVQEKREEMNTHKPIQKRDVLENSRVYTPPTKIKVESPAIIPEKQNKVEEHALDKYNEDTALSNEPVIETKQAPILSNLISAEDFTNPEPARETPILKMDTFVESMDKPIIRENDVQPIKEDVSIKPDQANIEKLFTPEPIGEVAVLEPEPIVEPVVEQESPIIPETTYRPAPAPFTFPKYTPPVQVKNSSLQIEDKEDAVPEFIDNIASKKEASVFVPKKTFTTITDESAGTGNYSRKIFMVIVSIILIVGGVGAGYYLYLKSPLAKPTVVPISTSKVPSIIKPETQKIVPIGNLKGVSLEEKIRSVVVSDAVAAGVLNEIVLTQTTGSSTIRVTALNFIKTIGYQTPEIFKRSLMNIWMLGAYGSDEGNAPFIIFKTDFFQNSYAGMLDWEKNMVDDLAILLNFEEKIKNQNNTGTSTVRGYLAVRGRFEDKIILNRDVRKFTNENGVSLLVYSFIDKDTLVITTSENVLRSIIQKLEKQTQIR
jgi:hypothetical protein